MQYHPQRLTIDRHFPAFKRKKRYDVLEFSPGESNRARGLQGITLQAGGP